MNIRTKIAVDNLSLCKKHIEHLSEWELDFLLSICENYGEDRLDQLTRKQFNTLHNISTDLRKRFYSAMR